MISGLGLTKNRDFSTVVSPFEGGFLVGAFRFRDALLSFLGFAGAGWGLPRPLGGGLRFSSLYATSSALSSTGNLVEVNIIGGGYNMNGSPHSCPQTRDEKLVLDGCLLLDPAAFDASASRVQEDGTTVDRKISK